MAAFALSGEAVHVAVAFGGRALPGFEPWRIPRDPGVGAVDGQRDVTLTASGARIAHGERGFERLARARHGRTLGVDTQPVAVEVEQWRALPAATGFAGFGGSTGCLDGLPFVTVPPPLPVVGQLRAIGHVAHVMTQSSRIMKGPPAFRRRVTQCEDTGTCTMFP